MIFGRCVAMLHDVLEDTFVTVEYLEEIGIGQDIIQPLLLLTRKKRERDEDRECNEG
jgi:(p)ppGpp synthase/HD superfamily hydrolase